MRFFTRGSIVLERIGFDTYNVYEQPEEGAPVMVLGNASWYQVRIFLDAMQEAGNV
jgi:hypothetical protein